MWKEDAERVATAIVKDLNGPVEPVTPFASAVPAIRIIECVLSLRRNFDNFVIPRVRAFAAQYSEVASCSDLCTFIDSQGGPDEVMKNALNFRSAVRGRTLLGVAEYLVDQQTRFEGGSEVDRLMQWAQWARPGDYLAVGVPGFGLAGFQYLRMLFGADTAKPDVHIIRYVSKVVGRTVSDIHALYILERAAELSQRSLRQFDMMIWNRGARGGR